ncbi:MAG: diguanylate cyclase [Archangium sp.]|nr:diguanylate cyclase [Archangium sp.]
MIPASIPPNETERLAELLRYRVLDTAREPAFERITRLASTLLETPIALVSLVDESRQWFKSEVGMGVAQTPRELSFCAHAIHDTTTMVVGDTHTDARFASNPLVLGDPKIRFYAGAPLTTPRGFNVGTLCVIDRKPRVFSSKQAQVLADLAALAVDELELRAARALAEQRAAVLQQTVLIFDNLPQGVVFFDAQFKCVYANKAMGEAFDLPPEQMLGWTPERANTHVAGLCDDPDEVLSRMQGVREVQTGESRSSIFLFARPRPRVMRRTLHRLPDPERPWLAMWTDISHEAALLRRSEQEASTDALTGLPNRRAAEAALNTALASGAAVSVALFDVDHFKRVNDTFGHPVGDEVLRRVGQTLAGIARGSDFVGRWGGEEFVAVVRTEVDGARAMAERVRAAVELLETSAGKVTLSAGVARVEKLNELGAVDAKLYEAKRSGRNRVAS